MALRDEQVRTLHFGSIGLAVVLVLIALLALQGAANATPRLAVIVLLVVLLAVQVWLFLEDRKAIGAAQQQGWQEPAQDVAPTPPPAAGEQAKMVIRCKQCGEVFPVEDTGIRPLVALCPHCGKGGTIKAARS